MLASFALHSPSNAGLVVVPGVGGVEGVEEGVPGGVIPPVAQVDAPHERDQPPLERLLLRLLAICRMLCCSAHWMLTCAKGARQCANQAIRPGEGDTENLKIISKSNNN